VSRYKFGIIANTEKTNVPEILPPFLNWLKQKGISFLVAAELKDSINLQDYPNLPSSEIAGECDIIWSFGGDGTFLQTARVIAPLEKPIVGVNLGDFGYLTEVTTSQLHQRVQEILDGEYIVQNRMMLDVTVPGLSTKNRFIGLNDLVIFRGQFPRTIYIETYIDGLFLNRFNADGLIISTPTGSTGYSLSAGGPIIEPGSGVMVINPISPHMMANRPLIIPSDKSIEIRTTSQGRLIQVSLDGQLSLEIESGSNIFVKRAEFNTRLILFKDHNYFELLRSKLNWRNQIDN